MGSKVLHTVIKFNCRGVLQNKVFHPHSCGFVSLRANMED